MIDCKPYVETLQGKPVAVFGLGVSGLASVRALSEAGAHVIAWDDNQERRDQAREAGAEILRLDEITMQGCAALVLSPGVPLHHPAPHDVVKSANMVNVEILCDIEILSRLNHGRKTIGITGTNGKSTTTALIHHVLNECNVSSAMGGNIGRAALDMDMPAQGGAFVLEISSYQMDLCPRFKPDIAVLLNITPDHLDRHGSMKEYEAAKRRIFGGAGQMQIDLPAIDARVRVCENMKGDHNLQNASAALLACEALGLSEVDILAAIKTFPGLNHRQYLVAQIGGVQYVNDSKATNAEAAAKALGSYEDIFWIAGGQAKEGGLNGLESLMPRVRHAFLIGEASGEFSTWMDKNNVPHSMNGELKNAFAEAHERAQKAGKGVVLLSPACASWDQFKSFEDRGDQFAALLKGLE